MKFRIEWYPTDAYPFVDSLFFEAKDAVEFFFEIVRCVDIYRKRKPGRRRICDLRLYYRRADDPPLPYTAKTHLYCWTIKGLPRAGEALDDECVRAWDSIVRSFDHDRYYRRKTFDAARTD